MRFKTKISNLCSTTALTVAKNKKPDVINLVKKTDHNRKICETKNKITTDHDYDKYINTQEFDELTARNFALRLA